MKYLIDNSEKGRIYVSQFALERLVYETLLADYKGIDCYAVDYDQSTVTIHLKKSGFYTNELLTDVIDKTIYIFNEQYGIYINNVDILIK